MKTMLSLLTAAALFFPGILFAQCPSGKTAEAISLINEARAKKGLPALKFSGALARRAASERPGVVVSDRPGKEDPAKAVVGLSGAFEAADLVEILMLQSERIVLETGGYQGAGFQSVGIHPGSPYIIFLFSREAGDASCAPEEEKAVMPDYGTLVFTCNVPTVARKAYFDRNGQYIRNHSYSSDHNSSCTPETPGIIFFGQREDLPANMAEYQIEVEPTVNLLVHQQAVYFRVPRGHRDHGTRHFEWSGDSLSDVKRFVESGGQINKIDGADHAILHRAVESNRLDVVQYLISKGADVNMQDDDRAVPLEYARTEEMARYLVSKGARSWNVGLQGWTSLHSAAAHGPVWLARHIVTGGGNVNARTTDGANPLYYSVYFGTPEMTAYLLTTGALRDVDPETGSLVHLAAEHGRCETIPVLVKAGLAVNARNSAGQTPLHRAALNSWEKVTDQDRRRCMDILISLGADKTLRDNSGTLAEIRTYPQTADDPEILKIQQKRIGILYREGYFRGFLVKKNGSWVKVRLSFVPVRGSVRPGPEEWMHESRIREGWEGAR